MNFLTRAIRGLIGLFIDDGKLALTVIAVLVLVKASDLSQRHLRQAKRE